MEAHLSDPTFDCSGFKFTSVQTSGTTRATPSTSQTFSVDVSNMESQFLFLNPSEYLANTDYSTIPLITSAVTPRQSVSTSTKQIPKNTTISPNPNWNVFPVSNTEEWSSSNPVPDFDSYDPNLFINLEGMDGLLGQDMGAVILEGLPVD